MLHLDQLDVAGRVAISVGVRQENADQKIVGLDDGRRFSAEHCLHDGANRRIRARDAACSCCDGPAERLCRRWTHALGLRV
jgi:hypothetical protein